MSGANVRKGGIFDSPFSQTYWGPARPEVAFDRSRRPLNVGHTGPFFYPYAQAGFGSTTKTRNLQDSYGRGSGAFTTAAIGCQLSKQPGYTEKGGIFDGPAIAEWCAFEDRVPQPIPFDSAPMTAVPVASNEVAPLPIAPRAGVIRLDKPTREAVLKSVFGAGPDGLGWWR